MIGGIQGLPPIPCFMPTYREYTTVNEVRSVYKEIAGAGDDPLFLEIIQEVSRMIDEQSNRSFVPQVDTRLFDLPPLRKPNYLFSMQTIGAQAGEEIMFDLDLLVLTTLTNGDGTVIDSSKYWLHPNNKTPKFSIALRPSSGLIWQPSSGGDVEQVISALGIWGYHDDYNNAWTGAGTITDGAGITANATTYTASTGHGIQAGFLLKMENEFVYVPTVATNLITIVRGVNGSTAAAHATATPVSYWKNHAGIVGLCRRSVASLYALRKNPIMDTEVIDGYRFQTPKDILVYIGKENRQMGLLRVGLN